MCNRNKIYKSDSSMTGVYSPGIQKEILLMQFSDHWRPIKCWIIFDQIKHFIFDLHTGKKNTMQSRLATKDKDLAESLRTKSTEQQMSSWISHQSPCWILLHYSHSENSSRSVHPVILYYIFGRYKEQKVSVQNVLLMPYNSTVEKVACLGINDKIHEDT